MQNMRKATHDGPSADPQVQGKRGYAQIGAEGCRLDPYHCEGLSWQRHRWLDILARDSH